MTFFHMKDFGGIKSAGLLIKKQSARYLSNKFMEKVLSLGIVVLQKLIQIVSFPIVFVDLDAVMTGSGQKQSLSMNKIHQIRD